VPESLLLHPPADVVDGLPAQPHAMEGVQHPHRVGQLDAQRGGVPPERVEGGEGDPLPPRLIPLADQSTC
jgi:hypothetical protein